MIHLKFSVNNLWFYEPEVMCNIDFFNKNGKTPFKYKFWETCFAYRPDEVIVGVELDLRWRGGDHAGLKFKIDLFGLHFNINMYDSRHWDYDTNDWVVYDTK